MKPCNIIIVILLGLGISARAQQVMTWKPLKAGLSLVNTKNQWLPFKQTSISKPAPTAYLNATAPQPDSYYQQCYGFFCKREWELQQKIHVPVKLRLGTYQTAQTQEGYT